MSRFPFSAFPRGWYQIAYSDELAIGGVMPIVALGEDLVLYRGADGVARVLDAHCPHLGAHLGHGGRVEGDCIRCPFHGWRFSGAGECVEIPRAAKIPPRAALRTHDVREQSGLILLAHGAPDWAPPAIAEYGQPGWTGYRRQRWHIRTHIQEMAENIVDCAHFPVIHQTLSAPETRVETVGHVVRARSTMMMPTPRGPVVGTIEWDGHGLGFWLLRLRGILETLIVGCSTPTDGEHVDVRFSFLSHGDPESRLASALVDDVCRQVDDDIPIWEHKIYRARPLLSAADGPIMAVRSWAAQFYDS